MRKNKLLLGVILVMMTFSIFQSCEKEIPLQDVGNSTLETVSKQESITFLENQMHLSKRANTYLTYDLSKIRFESITNSNTKLAVIPAKTDSIKQYSRVLLLKINDTLKSVVYHMYPNKEQETHYFSGQVTLTDLSGNVLKAFRYLNGEITNAYVLKTNKHLSKSSSDDAAECRKVCGHHQSDKYCVCNEQFLEEAVITDSSRIKIDYVPVAVLYGENDTTGSGSGLPLGGFGWNTGDQLTFTCPQGYVKDSNNNCIRVEDPCDDISVQRTNSNYQNIHSQLEGKIGLRVESGYLENKNGTFTRLNSRNNGHSLTINIDRRNTTGFIHTHTNDFFTGRFDRITGEEIIEKPIKLFSPSDIIKFLQLVKFSKHNGISLSKIYGTVVSIKGTYTLRFTGNIDDIKSSYSLDNDEYKKYFTKKHKNDIEKAFLAYLKDKIDLDGLRLYKIEDTKVEEKTLNATSGEVDSEDCD